MTVGILNPRGTDVGGAIVQNYICFPIFQFPSNEVTTLRGRDIRREGNDARDRFDGNEVDSYGRFQ